jgi:hypothetical protein
MLHGNDFSAAQLHARNVQLLFCEIVCRLMMDEGGQKHVAAGMSLCCDFSKIVSFRWLELL